MGPPKRSRDLDDCRYGGLAQMIDACPAYGNVCVEASRSRCRAGRAMLRRVAEAGPRIGTDIHVNRSKLPVREFVEARHEFRHQRPLLDDSAEAIPAQRKSGFAQIGGGGAGGCQQTAVASRAALLIFSETRARCCCV